MSQSGGLGWALERDGLVHVSSRLNTRPMFPLEHNVTLAQYPALFLIVRGFVKGLTTCSDCTGKRIIEA